MQRSRKSSSNSGRFGNYPLNRLAGSAFVIPPCQNEFSTLIRLPALRFVLVTRQQMTQIGRDLETHW
jgi:homogentisate 1,2-dioxygenase